MSALYPMLLDVSDRLIVIIGGGAVASRKALGLVAAGATRIRIVAPRFAEDIPPAVERIAEAYQPHHLDGAGLVFAATDSPQVNETVVKEARRLGVLVCRADGDDEQGSDFLVPAALRRGPLTVAVSASGAPAIAAAVRDEIAAGLSDGWVKLAEAMQQIRPMIKSAGLPIARRRVIFRDLATHEAVQILSTGGIEALRGWLISKYPDLVPSPGTPGEG